MKDRELIRISKNQFLKKRKEKRKVDCLWPNPAILFFSVWLDFQNVMAVIFPKQEEDNTHTEILFFLPKIQRERRKTGMFRPNKGRWSNRDRKP